MSEEATYKVFGITGKLTRENISFNYRSQLLLQIRLLRERQTMEKASRCHPREIPEELLLCL